MVRKLRGRDICELVPVNGINETVKAFNESIGDSILKKGDTDNLLFTSVKKGRTGLQSTIDDWIEIYRQDKDVGTLELLQFFVLSSGCTGKITAEMKETLDFTKIVRKLVEEFDDQAGGDYPIITNGPQWKKFRINFCEFVQILIRQCQYSIIYDQYLMENMISFLITLSDSQVRAFRHTATLAAVKLMTALVDVALTLSINIDNNQRQYDKARLEKSRDKLNVLSAKRTELDENMKDIQTILGYLFKSIFVHRYKDIVPEIRSLCMYEIGIWMRKFPNHFLDDPHLKYIGWTIHDKESDVRLKCLQALLPLYENEEIVQRMELFTNKYKDRFIAMAMDKDYEVAVHAVKLLINILKHYRDILSTKDCEKMYMLLYTTNRNVAQAAGEFLIEKLFQIDEEAIGNLCSRRGKKLSPYTAQLKDLITFFIECETHEHCAYLVDSLIENHPMMKDWECMTDLLLEEPNLPEESLGEKQETVLIDLMSCAVKQTATGEPPVDRVVRRSKMSAKDIATLNEEKEKISLHFSSVIPDLLRKYKGDADKIINLLEIPLHFLPNTYSQNSDDMEKLLTVISELIEIHSETEVIEKCASIYEFMQEENFTHYRLVRVEVSTLLDTLIQKYKDSLAGLCEGSDDELETISFVTKKISPIVSCCHEMDTVEIWNLFFEKWIKDYQSSDESNKFADEATKNALTICFHLLIWRLHFVNINGNHNIDLKLERSKLVEFINEAFILLDHTNQPLADEIYFILCDIFIIFSPHLAHDSPPLSDLICQPNKSQTERLINFIESNVFIRDDQSEDEPQMQDTVEKLYKKRHLLAAFCKLIIYNVIPMRYSNCILRYYVDFFNDFGDIIKTTLGKLREMNKVICAKTIANTLIQVFKELQSESDENPAAFTKQDENFLALKELAKRFALSFGLDNQKNRDAIASLHREGIHFSFEEIDNPIDPLGPPPNLPFLEILIEFSNKIFKQDKKTVLTYLDKCVKNTGVDIDEWQPLVLYRNSLAQVNEFDISLNRSRTRVTRKRAHNADDDASIYDETPVKRVRKRYVSFSVSNIEDSTSMD